MQKCVVIKMSEIRVICPNHGIINRVNMDVMWIGEPPRPETTNAFCPLCGAKTIIERDELRSSVSYTYSKNDDKEYKEREINYYKEKYKGQFK
jgi:hypothetical protein